MVRSSFPSEFFPDKINKMSIFSAALFCSYAQFEGIVLQDGLQKNTQFNHVQDPTAFPQICESQ